jgi:hypothetical protein
MWGGGGSHRRSPFVVAAQRAAPILLCLFSLNCVFFVHFKGGYLFIVFKV